MVSVLAQNLYMMCTLSKSQMKTITSFWKEMIGFIAPEAAPTANKIHVSYTTCLREAQRRYDEAEERHRKMFRDCLHVSIAVDTSQFGQDNYLSCVGRFGFEDSISQEILIFEKTTAKTGTWCSKT